MAKYKTALDELEGTIALAMDNLSTEYTRTSRFRMIKRYQLLVRVSTYHDLLHAIEMLREKYNNDHGTFN